MIKLLEVTFNIDHWKSILQTAIKIASFLHDAVK